MEYIHPLKYEGLRFDTPNNQLTMKEQVEVNCLKCDLFMGKEHDFSQCDMKVNCPKECRKAVSLIEHTVKCRMEGEEQIMSNYNVTSTQYHLANAIYCEIELMDERESEE